MHIHNFELGQADHAPASVRWVANVSENGWNPSDEEYESLLAGLPADEVQRIRKLVRKEDAKRSVLGRLMLKSAAAKALNMEADDVKFGRTKGRKPFIQEAAAARRGLNANVSHHGEWVVLGLEEKGLVGVDVSSTKAPRKNMQAQSFFADMAGVLTGKEWAAVHGAGRTDEEQYHAFFTFWALKEAYTKATGIGMALPFPRLELSVPRELLCLGQQQNQPIGQRVAGDGKISARLDGRAQPEWDFELYRLDGAHIMAVAVGPHAQAVPSYQDAMSKLLAPPKTAPLPPTPHHITHALKLPARPALPIIDARSGSPDAFCGLVGQPERRGLRFLAPHQLC